MKPDMTEDYLDISKSVMISSPAGSGKTEKLSRRYISLLKGGSEVERILAITFTEKAAAEMKERILKILKEEDPKEFEKVREKMPRMRISTIHSFCLKLLKRFCIDLGVDPSLEVMDSFNQDILWSEAVYESLREEGISGERLFYETIKDKGVKGWNRLYIMLCDLHEKRPHIEFWIRSAECGMRGAESEEKGSGNEHFRNVIVLYKRCLERYREKKLERHYLDYNDLELMAYEAISRNPEWQNVLFSFDEHTDHILVDEFQDTSSFQWRIIDKLTEEWRSGLGSKRDSGIIPTIFLVGDDKQSIYSFRGANVSVFRNAREKLHEWLGRDYHFIEAKENYRSLPGIVDFVNALFEKLMPRGLYDDDWKIEYSPFEATRKGEGSVEISIIEGIGNVRDDRKREAYFVSEKIRELHNRYEIYDGDSKRKCSYGDMAILLRSRTHLSVFEDALRSREIPFVVVKGIGFYHTPEVSLLKDILFFLIDPMDDYSLFNILRSPLFSVNYDSLLNNIAETGNNERGFGHLYQHIISLGGEEGLRQSEDRERLQDAVASLGRWLGMAKEHPYAVMLEEVLSETSGWQYLHERQRYVNAKKFIRLVEELESNGLAGLEIREKLIKASENADEPKANVNIEGMDAVRIMTVHASKGLQFPIVFLPCLDEAGKPGGSSIAMDEDGERIIVAYEDDSDKRKAMPIFQRQKEKTAEEEKRLFYVASTRAMDCLCMSGVLNDKPKGKLAYLFDAFNLDIQHLKEDIQKLPFRINRTSAEDLEKQPVAAHEPRPRQRTDVHAFRNEMSFIEPIDRDYRPLSTWHDVTEEIGEIKKKHGDDWVVLGRTFHRLFESLSMAVVSADDMEQKIISILRNEAVNEKSLSVMKGIILSDIKRLGEAHLLKDIILHRENSYAELPFVFQRGSRIYKGRIDRIIIRGDKALIYDYKTYPVAGAEIPELRERYAFQMELYKEAVRMMFSLRTEAYLFFTHESLMVNA